MESVANQVAPGERLVTLEDDRVVLRIRLVTALATPLRVVHQLRVEASAQTACRSVQKNASTL